LGQLCGIGGGITTGHELWLPLSRKNIRYIFAAGADFSEISAVAQFRLA